jgi:hypothetical protein
MYFLVSDEESAQTPSRKDEIDETQEFNARLFGCEFVRRCGRMLKLNQSCIATGQVLLHRFYFKKSLKKFDVKRMAATSIWLASKLEESPRKLRDVVNVLVRVEERMEGKKKPSYWTCIQIDSRILKKIWYEKKGTCSKSLGL